MARFAAAAHTSKAGLHTPTSNRVLSTLTAGRADRWFKVGWTARFKWRGQRQAALKQLTLQQNSNDNEQSTHQKSIINLESSILS
jgi:hypothetical protein